ncbi:MAG: cupin domain-containing protein [Cellulomonas sp.]|uniref:cupin domain-containing protein n=1 Tax=Cellulomonas sp. TaxID=40001 RepID=UPI002586D016|nr:cupin domain-containing protein [Cellulomonas sp.]MCR6704845.1 cupin domain-containing protein [Cellulomonas sp.]
MTVSTGPHARFTVGTVQVKPWGHEHIYAEGEHGYVGKLLVVRAGEQLSLQYHVDKDETMVVVSGDALIEHGAAADLLVPQQLGAGDVVHLPAGVLHRLTAVTDVLLAESSTAGPGWRDDVVRLADRYGRADTSHP